MKFFFPIALALLAPPKRVLAYLSQADESEYLSKFELMKESTYSILNEPEELLPYGLNVCYNSGSSPAREVTVKSTNGVVDSATVADQCSDDSVCTIPLGTTLKLDSSLNLGALVVRGIVEWTDSTQEKDSIFLCAGYVAVEGIGSFEMNLQQKNSVIYIKDNGAVHPVLRSRAFGSVATESVDYPIIDISGREVVRTWSLLSQPLLEGDNEILLMHNANLMGWKVGDRIGIAATEPRATGTSEEFTIVDIDERGVMTLNKPAAYYHDARFFPPAFGGEIPSLMASEVINLSRNIVITGDDFKHIPCDSNLPEAVPGEQTSTLGCRCSSFRSQCTVGLHTSAMNSGTARIQNTRIERCGQRGIEGKYCLHFHKLHDCPTCLFRNNAIEGSHQRGIIIHSTHSSTVEGNTLYNVRGAGIYIEDGNEMYNDVKFNAILCPYPFRDGNYHGCTVPGTSNRIADTSDNQSGIFSRAATNSLTGNRVSNAFNGMLLNAGSIGRGESYGKVCEADAKVGRVEGNVFHGSGRFGTYTLGGNYAKFTDQSISSNGHNIDKTLCDGFDSEGLGRGVAAAILNNLDFNNAFVGHYEAGEIQHRHHMSYNNNNLMYWKETKNFDNGCSAHISGGSYAHGNMALPDQATFVIEKTEFGDYVSLEFNHHCNVGTTGVLCFPQYILDNVYWKNSNKSKKWFEFQSRSTQDHNANQNYGGVFSLAPPDADVVSQGGQLEHSVFPPGFVSLVSSKYSYLLSIPDQQCVPSNWISPEDGFLYDDGILCKVPLRALKVYTRGLLSGSAPDLKVEMWFEGGIDDGAGPDASQLIKFHQVGSDYDSPKQGYSFPVVPGAEHFYRLSLLSGDGSFPTSWVVEFSDFVIGNRYEIEYINLSLNGRLCGSEGLVSSHHDRRFMWSGDEFMGDAAWGNTGACAQGSLDDFPKIDCSLMDNGELQATECPSLCNDSCGEGQYCDCGSASCKCKPGYSGNDCEVDLCADARCGEHGTCSAKYLGGSLPVTTSACICDEGWSGPLCQYNPCETSGIACVHGKCVASSDSTAQCQCDSGYSGDSCDESCDAICVGSFPYGCAENIEGIVNYGCNKNGGCSYLNDGEDYPFDGFCTYKSVREESNCLCGVENDCELTVPCNSDGSCPTPEFAPDSSPCNSVPLGICQNGKCIGEDGRTSIPTKIPSPQPTIGPSKSPAIQPTPSAFYCGCETCTEPIWDTIATDDSGSYSCGDRITWLQSEKGLSEFDACARVSNEFSSLCGQFCDPTSCNQSTKAPTSSPTASPTKAPTYSPTTSPTTKPTAQPTNVPTNEPTDQGLNFCGCESCTSQIWNLIATDSSGSYTCGSRITWLQSQAGGSKSEYDACLQVANEFPSVCGLECNPEICNDPNDPITSSPTTSPTETPTKKTVEEFTFCGCESCTEQIWNSVATDGSGSHTCGSRISWLQSQAGGSKMQYDACVQVANEFPSICGPECNPETCTPKPTKEPSRSPSLSPTNDPNQISFCGCSSCTEKVWGTPAIDGAGDFTCGSRITWLQTSEGGSHSEYEACLQVAEEFPTVCGPDCNPSTCNSFLEDPDPSKLIWSDEFDVDGTPDPTKWAFDLGDGCNIGLCNWGNGEQAYYTNSPSNVDVSHGILRITAKKESGFSLPYSSARMVTRGLHSFKYGRIQFKANLRSCQSVGTWPALWLLPEYKVYGGWPASGEIDVMEAVGHEPNRFFGTVHTELYNGMAGTQKGSSISKPKSEWHIFEINWEEDRIQFAVDKQVYHVFSSSQSSAEWPFDQYFHIVMNVAVGGSWGGQEGIDQASFEGEGQSMEIDWVRVYSS